MSQKDKDCMPLTNLQHKQTGIRISRAPARAKNTRLHGSPFDWMKALLDFFFLGSECDLRSPFIWWCKQNNIKTQAALILKCFDIQGSKSHFMIQSTYKTHILYLLSPVSKTRSLLLNKFAGTWKTCTDQILFVVILCIHFFCNPQLPLYIWGINCIFNHYLSGNKFWSKYWINKRKLHVT